MANWFAGEVAAVSDLRCGVQVGVPLQYGVGENLLDNTKLDLHGIAGVATLFKACDVPLYIQRLDLARRAGERFLDPLDGIAVDAVCACRQLWFPHREPFVRDNGNLPPEFYLGIVRKDFAVDLGTGRPAELNALAVDRSACLKQSVRSLIVFFLGHDGLPPKFVLVRRRKACYTVS